MSADQATELPRAYVVPRKGGLETVLGQEICDLVRSRLVSYKKLTGGVVFVGQIPRTPSGKVQRFKLLDSTHPRPRSWLWPSIYGGVQLSIRKLRRKLSTVAIAAGKYLGGPATAVWLIVWHALQVKHHTD